MESQSSPSTSGRAMLFSASRPAVVLCILLLSCALASAQWVVETNSFRIKEPSSAAGEHDAAIGDVSAPIKVAYRHSPCASRLTAKHMLLVGSSILALLIDDSLLRKVWKIAGAVLTCKCWCAVWSASLWRSLDRGDCVHGKQQAGLQCV